MFPVPPPNPYLGASAGFGSRPDLLLPFIPNRYASLPRRGTSSDNDSAAGATDRATKKTIHDTIAESLLFNSPENDSRTGIVALIERYNSHAHPRDVIKIEHPTEADKDIEAAIWRMEVLERALREAEKLYDAEETVPIEDPTQEKLRDAKLVTVYNLSVGACSLFRHLEGWLVRALQNNKAGDSTEQFAEIGQRAKEVEDSWVGGMRSVLSEITQVREGKEATHDDVDALPKYRRMPCSVDSVTKALQVLNGDVTMYQETMGNNLRTVLEIVLEYPKVGLHTVARTHMEKVVHEVNTGREPRMIGNTYAEWIARYLLEISSQNLTIDNTVVEYSRRALVRIRRAETVRDVGLRRLMEKEFRFSQCWPMLLRPCNVGYGETLKTWISNSTDLVDGLDGAKDRFETPFRALDENPDWAEVYAASLLYGYGKLVLQIGEKYDETMIKEVTNLANKIHRYEARRGNFDLCAGEELLRQLTAFDVAKTPASLESLSPLGLTFDAVGFLRLFESLDEEFPPSLMEHQFPPGINGLLVLRFLKHIHFHHPEDHETQEKIVDVSKRILARAKASEGSQTARSKQACGGECSKKHLNSPRAPEVPDFVLVEAESSKSNGKGKGKAVDYEE